MNRKKGGRRGTGAVSRVATAAFLGQMRRWQSRPFFNVGVENVHVMPAPPTARDYAHSLWNAPRKRFRIETSLHLLVRGSGVNLIKVCERIFRFRSCPPPRHGKPRR